MNARTDTVGAATRKLAPRLSALKLNRRTVAWLKVPVWALCLLPFVLVFWDGFHGALGANPVEAVIHRMGDWTLRLLCLTLTISPLRELTGWAWLVRFRRLLGLFAFFYLMLHFSAYFVFDQSLSLARVAEDVAKRPYILVGFAALCLLVPLAVTSTQGWMKRLGRRWKSLHRLVYPAAILGVLHYYLEVKADITEPLIYAAVLAALLGFRYYRRRQRSA